MYLREKPEQTLAKVMDTLECAPGTNVRTTNANISVQLMDRGENEGRITVRPREGSDLIEIPMTEAGMRALAGWLDVPAPYLLRSDTQLQEMMLNYLLHDSLSSFDEGIFRVSEQNGIIEVRSPAQRVIEPRAIVDIMQRVIDPIAPVIGFWSTPDEFRLDTVVPEGFDRGIGGDPRVGDLTCGGVRVVQNRKLNHAPEIAGYLYRLECTNGMHVAEPELAIDARGQSVEEVLAEIEQAAEQVMGRIERRIESFYALREDQVRTPEQALVTMAQEHGISGRVLNAIIRRVPTITDDNDTTTMFDLVNLVTNQANEPSIDRRAGSRLLLEQAGGAVMVEHAERCAHCQTKLAV